MKHLIVTEDLVLELQSMTESYLIPLQMKQFI